MSVDPDIESRARAVIADEMGLRRDCLRSNARLESDLGCTGDDAERHMLRMQGEFEIDMSEFELLRHFSPEVRPWPPFGYGLFLGWMSVCILAIARRYFSLEVFVVPAVVGWLVMRRYRWTDPFPVKSELTVADLVNAATSGRWPSTLGQK